MDTKTEQQSNILIDPDLKDLVNTPAWYKITAKALRAGIRYIKDRVAEDYKCATNPDPNSYYKVKFNPLKDPETFRLWMDAEVMPLVEIIEQSAKNMSELSNKLQSDEFIEEGT